MKIRQVKKFDIFTLKLINNPSTGYIWKYNTLDGIDLINQTHQLAQDDLIGGPTETTFYFKPNKAGEYVLILSLVRPWEKNTSPIQVYQENIYVS